MINAKWIWTDKNGLEDSYSEFSFDSYINDISNTKIQIACDSNYAFFVNNNLISFTGCADYPTYKLYNEINLADSLENGFNDFRIEVWYQGVESQTYYKDTPGLIFEITQNGKPIIWSDENTPARPILKYKFGLKKQITSQLGPSFYYDSTAIDASFSHSVIVDKSLLLRKREIKELELGKPHTYSIREIDEGYLVDLGSETAGFLSLSFNSECEQEVLISYGEHIETGQVLRKIGDRDFSVQYYAHKGFNEYVNYFRRIAGRYLEIHCQKPLYSPYFAIVPVNYPVRVKPYDFHDELMNEIYETSVKTLRLCMHEHYEDCPWREQALYTMDSRNQILCGYYCFENGNKDYVRHNLTLISHGMMDCGLLDICYPINNHFPIPMFSLCYLIEVAEYIKYTGDNEILDTVGDTINTIVKTFVDSIDETGLIPEFDAPAWNFYEWSEGSEGKLFGKNGHTVYSSILNCMFVLAINTINSYYPIDIDTEEIKLKIDEKFCKNGEFVLASDNDTVTQLANSLACLIGLGSDELIEKMMSGKMIEATLSMKAFYYDALIRYGKEECVIKEIKDIYGYMLSKGATSFWETIEGASAFGNAGSLCHGWSAIPVYYFNIISNIK